MFPTMYRDGMVSDSSPDDCTHPHSSKAHWPIWWLEVPIPSFAGHCFFSNLHSGEVVSVVNVIVLLFAPVSNAV